MKDSQDKKPCGYWLPLPEDEQKYIEEREWKCIYVIRYDSTFVRSYCFFCPHFHMLKIPYQMLGAPVGVGKLAKLFCRSWECPIDYGRDEQHKDKPQSHFIMTKDESETPKEYGRKEI